MNFGIQKFQVFLGKSLLLGTLVFCAVPSLRAQSDPLLEHFSISKNEGNVLLNWVTRPGNTCEGIDVMRSVDSLQFETIYHISGICGGPNTAISYSYLDEHPVANRRNFYRLELGSVGKTSVRAIEVVDLGGQGLQVRPNPVVATSKVYFDNATRELCKLSLIHPSGMVVGQWETRDEFFELNGSEFQPSMYYLRIQDADGKLKARGKVLVVR